MTYSSATCSRSRHVRVSRSVLSPSVRLAAVLLENKWNLIVDIVIIKVTNVYSATPRFLLQSKCFVLSRLCLLLSLQLSCHNWQEAFFCYDMIAGSLSYYLPAPYNLTVTFIVEMHHWNAPKCRWWFTAVQGFDSQAFNISVLVYTIYMTYTVKAFIIKMNYYFECRWTGSLQLKSNRYKPMQ